MSYDLDQFIADCRGFLTRDPGPKGREQVRLHLERLLNNPDFVRAYCADDAPRGLKVLYEPGTRLPDSRASQRQFNRIRIDTKTGEVHQMTPQQAT
jgi:hypothetical protein